MITKTISYDDLDGNPVVEDFSFHLNKAEMVKIRVRYSEDLEEYFKKIVAENDADKMFEVIEDVIRRSVGKRGEDGKTFLRPKEVVDGFMGSDAYSELLLELLSDKGMSPTEFFRGIIPTSVLKEVDAQENPAKDPTTMTREELLAAMRAREEEKK